MKTILALGADIKNRFLIANGNTLRFGPDIGDLSEAKNYEIFKKEILKATKKIKPDIILCDLHPNYFSTRFANEYGLKLKAYSLKPVQHHHAHVASVMREHGLENPVIGVSFDGTGFGADGNIWGGEFLLVSNNGFKRVAHLEYNKMPGGEKVVKEPWRMVLSIIGKKGLPFIKSAGMEEKNAVILMCEKNINSPLTSSAGRLFDAAAAMLGICEHASGEAEGPIKLEAMCESGIEDSYEFGASRSEDRYVINTKSIFLAMCADLKRGKRKSKIATTFHNSMVNIVVNTIKKLSKDTGVRCIALSGGVFQNKFLKTKITNKLTALGFSVLTNQKTPINDFNIALGQYHVLSSAGKN